MDYIGLLRGAIPAIDCLFAAYRVDGGVLVSTLRLRGLCFELRVLAVKGWEKGESK